MYRILFEIFVCWLNLLIKFEEENYSLKPSKRLDCLRKACCQASAAACLALSPPLFTRPVPMIHWKFGFWSELHCIYFLTIVLSTIVAVRMKFDLTCRQRNLSSTTSLVPATTGRKWPLKKKFPLRIQPHVCRICPPNFFFLQKTNLLGKGYPNSIECPALQIAQTS